MSKLLSKILDEDNTFTLYFIDYNSNNSEEWVFKFIYRDSVLIGLTINENIQYICSVITEDHLEFRRQVNIKVTMEAYIHELIYIPSLYKERLILKLSFRIRRNRRCRI